MRKTPEIHIFVACHKPVYVPDNPLLTPVQVGADLTKDRYEGMKYDNEGDNISRKNPEYCELTAQYWAWKNVDCDYYGFFHYRRYLAFNHVCPVEDGGRLKNARGVRPYIELDDIWADLNPYGLSADVMREQIIQYDLITVFREKINTTSFHQYCQYHDQKNLDKILEIIKKEYPAYSRSADEYMKSKNLYYMNMYIMKKDLFREYAEWLFHILSIFEAEYPTSDQMEPRLMGYLAERLFGVFYTYQRKKGARCAETPYLKFYNTNIDKIRDVSAEVRVFQLKPTRFKIKIDMRKLNHLFPAGSYRRILLRSVFLR